MSDTQTRDDTWDLCPTTEHGSCKRKKKKEIRYEYIITEKGERIRKKICKGHKEGIETNKC